ncbi:tetratricopeptide repeat-containing sensor histidine kinase [Tenacibaculum amylolyticum]|uniref:tetratricopeptide repeat-containing sensor histidine kinase n=1 Tax=Tenacibaculum amylolyticum TaxID=104269 RepID=UPI003893A7CD
MKKVIVLLFAILSFCAFSQEDFDRKVILLKSKISKTKGIEKLKLLDSLSRFISVDKVQHNFDSITQETINYAFKFKDYDIVFDRTSALIFYYANRINKPRKAVEVFNDFKNKQMNYEDNDLLARLYTNAGDAYFFSGEIKTSISIYNKAEDFALKDNDSSLYASARTYKASAYIDTGNYAKGAQLLNETASFFTRKKDTFKLLGARIELANLYSRIGFYKEAEIERNQIIKIKKYQGKRASLIPTLYNAAIDENKKGNQHKRIEYLEIAHKKINNNEAFYFKPILYYGLLSAYSQNDSLVKAKNFFHFIEENYGTLENIPYEARYRSCLADYYLGIKKFKKSKIEAEKALAIFSGSNDAEGTYQSYEKLAKANKALGDFEKAYDYSLKYRHSKDSVDNVQKARALSYYQTLYETEKRDFKIASQASEISLLGTQNELNKQRTLIGIAGLLALFSIIYLTRSRKFAVTKKGLQEQFSRNLINSQEEERLRIARELHDSVGQKLMLLSKQAKTKGENDLSDISDNTLEEIRSIARGLHPSNLERLGLTQSINALVYHMDMSTDLFFTEEIEVIDHILDKEAELHLFRIIQESLANIIKHAEARAVKIKIAKTAKDIKVMVHDNGKGFDFETKLKNKSLGLKTLLERTKIIGAILRIDSKINQGTLITLQIPTLHE